MVSEVNKILNMDCLEGMRGLPSCSVDCCVTSPPYFGLRDYNVNGQLGLEETPELYVEKMVAVFGEVKRVLKGEGTLWLNIGDTYNAYKANTGDTKYAGISGRPIHKQGLTTKLLKNKDLIGIPWMLAFALRADGWYLRQDIIWHKPNPMPESVTDRCTKSHEYIFLLSKSAKYYYDYESIKTKSLEIKYYSKTHKAGNKCNPTKSNNGFRPRETEAIYEMANKRSVWTVHTLPYSEAHFATFPQELIVDCIKAGCPENGLLLDPFMGAGTSALVARKLNRNFIGFELNPDYVLLAENRLKKELGMFI